jgi:hypothetical protein
MAQPRSREQFKEYCLRALGAPVIEINVDDDQLEDRIDEALEQFQEFHYEATYRTFLKHQLTDSDVSNQWIPISSDIISVKSLFPIRGSSTSNDFMDVRYQIRLEQVANLHTFAGDLAYYEQMQQYLSLLEMKLTGTPQVDFVYHQGRLYIHGDLVDGDLEVGDYVVAEVYTIIDPNTWSSVWNNKWLKEYTVALFKRQWALNIKKFENVQLPGGVTLNATEMYTNAMEDIRQLKDDLRLEHELPIDFFSG